MASNFSQTTRTAGITVTAEHIEVHLSQVAAQDILHPSTILLIGTTGSGKSSLGNFFFEHSFQATSSKQPAVNPDGRRRPEMPFRTAHDNKPCTDRVSTEVRYIIDPQMQLRIMDTPGLNESAKADLSHMIDVIKQLHKIREVNACILCVKFNAKLDSQYVSTIKYYREMLPQLFDKESVIVVFTAYSGNPYEVAKRKAEEIDEDRVIDNALDFIVEHAKLSHRPEYFRIDSKPVTDDDRKFNREIRKTMLSRINSFKKEIKTHDMLIAKTPALLELHKSKAEQLAGEISGYNERLRQLNEEAADVLKKTEAQKARIAKLESEIEDFDKRYKAINTDDLIPLKVHQNKLGKRFFGFLRRTEEFNVTADEGMQPEKFVKWDNGHLNWEGVVYTHPKSVRGRVVGEFFHGIHYSVTLLGKKKIRHAEEIKQIEHDRMSCDDERKELCKKVDEASSNEAAYNKQIKTLLKYIEEREVRKKLYLSTVMNANEATRCAKEL